jgi:hypothetical protein
LKTKNESITDLLLKENSNKDSIKFSLKQILYKLQLREKLLEQGVKFHATAQDVRILLSF